MLGIVPCNLNATYNTVCYTDFDNCDHNVLTYSCLKQLIDSFTQLCVF